MGWTMCFLALLLVSLVAAELPLAEECDEEACLLPQCRCSSSDIPGGLLPRNTPQFVTVTFDDGVNVRNIETYREILYDRKNSNGCPAGTTFYINHEYTDYQLVNELYNKGLEIALHSISHRTPQSFWATASYEIMSQEFGEQRAQMAHFANIPYDDIIGMRIPFLQMNGNTSFQVMADFGLQYDCSWPTISLSPTLWPYTLDYASKQDCITPPCPTASIQGPWVMPMVTWTDLNGFSCGMVDTCFFVPNLDDEDGWYRFILTNFERHYLGNRAPFGFYVHEWYIASNPAVKRALVRFMDLINNLNDAFMVNTVEVLEWIKDPIPVNEYVRKPCRTWIESNCPRSSCMVHSSHNNRDYFLQICNVCPAEYPWVGNPLGLAREETLIVNKN